MPAAGVLSSAQTTCTSSEPVLGASATGAFSRVPASLAAASACGAACGAAATALAASTRRSAGSCGAVGDGGPNIAQQASSRRPPAAAASVANFALVVM